MKPFVLSLPESDAIQRTPIATIENAMKMKSGLIILQPGEEVGEHNTKEREELIVVMKGSATVEIDGQVFSEISSGSVAYLPVQTCHNVKNKTGSVLRYIYIVA